MLFSVGSDTGWRIFCMPYCPPLTGSELQKQEMATRTCFGGSGVIFSAGKFCSFSREKVRSLSCGFGKRSSFLKKWRQIPELTKNPKVRLLQVVISGSFKFGTNCGPQNRFSTNLMATIGCRWSCLEVRSVNSSLSRHQTLQMFKKSQKRNYRFLICPQNHWLVF